jgi:predicted nucleotidyltransferase component of viral defense system
LLYRLSNTSHRDRFVLKGAMLMTTWFDDPHRPTRDVDFLGYGDSTPESMLAVFREVCAIEGGDGVIFDVDALRVELIREELEYGGLRLRTTARLAGARITVVIDIGFGDAIEPGIEEINLPALLDFPEPRLRAYARETVVAEKFQAMVMLGLANSRMKDYYDIWMLSRSYDFDAERLSCAIAATFARRGTAIPEEVPDALTAAFATDATKQRQWAAFVRDLAADVPALEAIVTDLADFLMPFAQQARHRSVGG